MKFLVDAQLPKSLSSLLVTIGYDGIHTLDLPDKNLSQDNFLLLVARNEDRVIITKDFDFLESQMVRGESEKLILIKTGNIKNQELLSFDRKEYRINDSPVGKL